jgi:NTP pyrophosphatase (non-canonical NTP hydrolase)
MNGNDEKYGKYGAMVRELAKPGELLLKELTPEQCHIWHMGTGCCTEAGELLDACKKFAVYQKPLDRANVIEELGDLEFFMEGVRQAIGVAREEVLAANVEKLRFRYGDRYSNAAAQARADKWQNPKAERRSPKETRNPKSEESGVHTRIARTVQTPEQAFVDEGGVFHCTCGRTHNRGPYDGAEVYRCLGCGNSYRAAAVVREQM